MHKTPVSKFLSSLGYMLKANALKVIRSDGFAKKMEDIGITKQDLLAKHHLNIDSLLELGAQPEQLVQIGFNKKAVGDAVKRRESPEG